MIAKRHTPTLIIGVILALLSTIVLLINYYYYAYPGNDYFPPQYVESVILLGLMLLGTFLFFGHDNPFTLRAQYLVYWFIVLSLIGIATNAVQYTPFPVIDTYIIKFESDWGLHLGKLMNWAFKYPWFITLLTTAYQSLVLQIFLLPLLVIIYKRFVYLEEFFFLLLFTCLLGFGFYYFFPTIAPATLINSPHFSVSQQATALKFYQLHHYIVPTTIDGGMISLPSFHAIWAWFCLYLVRSWRFLFVCLLPLNILLVSSCVLLGWHYVSDILASVILVLLAHLAYYLCYKNQ